MAKLPEISAKVASRQPTPPYMTYPLDPHHSDFATMLSKKNPRLFKSYARAFVTYQKEVHTATKRLEEKVRKMMIETGFSPDN